MARKYGRVNFLTNLMSVLNTIASFLGAFWKGFSLVFFLHSTDLSCPFNRFLISKYKKCVHGYIAWWVAAQNFWFSRVFGCSLGRSVGEPFGESGFVLPYHFESASVQRNLAVVEPATRFSLNYIGWVHNNCCLGC